MLTAKGGRIMKEIRIFWAGDSTVKQNFYNTYPQTGIGQVMNRYFKREVQVYNYAQNGRSTKSFIEEGHLALIDKELSEGDYFFIQFGHNDSKPDEERRTEPDTTFKENLKKYIQVARSHNATPVLITPASRRHFNENGEFIPSHGEYPRAMREVAVEENVSLIDLNKKSEQLVSETGDEASKKWYMIFDAGIYEKEAYCNGLLDNTHFQYEGAMVMGKLVAESLLELGGEYSELIEKEALQ